jgi:alanyl-tRNA synthetase
LRAAEESKKKDKLKELKEQEKKRSLEVNSRLQEASAGFIDKAVKINGVNTVIALEPGLDMNGLRLLADKVKNGLRQGVVALGSEDNQQKKAYLVIAITPDLAARGLDAGSLIRQVAPVIGGSGGGRQDFAQAGGVKPENFRLAFEQLRDIIKNLPVEGR